MVLLYIVLRVSLDDIRKRVHELESRIADGAEELYPLVEQYKRILRLSEEEGEAELIEELELAYDEKLYSRLFSRGIINLLSVLSTQAFESISELARTLGRDPANVYKDLKWLESLGLVTLHKVGKSTAVKLNVIEYGLRFV